MPHKAIRCFGRDMPGFYMLHIQQRFAVHVRGSFPKPRETASIWNAPAVEGQCISGLHSCVPGALRAEGALFAKEETSIIAGSLLICRAQRC